MPVAFVSTWAQIIFWRVPLRCLGTGDMLFRRHRCTTALLGSRIIGGHGYFSCWLDGEAALKYPRTTAPALRW
jgi:hypothetical protein